MVNKKTLIIITIIVLASSSMLFFYGRIKVSRQIQGVPSFLVTHNSPLEKKIETFIQDYHDESLAYLVSALVVESKELSNKYLNLAEN